MIALRFDLTLRQDAFTLNARDSASVEVLGLFGPSGSGKTSLLETIAGIRRPDRAEIQVGDRVLLSTATGVDVPARDRGIGYVPQDALLFPHLDVKANIEYGRRSSRGTRPRVSDGFFDALVSMLEIEPLLGRRVQKLSGGEKQRVAIARALMIQPTLLLLDEPLAAVDRGRRDLILPYLLRIRRDLHVPLIYVTHDAAELMTIADRVLRLEAGEIVASGTPSDVLQMA